VRSLSNTKEETGPKACSRTFHKGSPYSSNTSNRTNLTRSTALHLSEVANSTLGSTRSSHLKRRRGNNVFSLPCTISQIFCCKTALFGRHGRDRVLQIQECHFGVVIILGHFNMQKPCTNRWKRQDDDRPLDIIFFMTTSPSPSRPPSRRPSATGSSSTRTARPPWGEKGSSSFRTAVFQARAQIKILKKEIR
jgi:hypothetical protein